MSCAAALIHAIQTKDMIPNQTNHEFTKQLTADLLTEIPKRFPDVIIWRNNRVGAKAVGKNNKTRYIKAGIDGQGDLSGIAGPGGRGRRIEIEIKGPTDRLSAKQIGFRQMIVSHGGIYLVATSVEQAINEFRQAVYISDLAGGYTGVLRENL
jgi:hypothetical protein